MLRKAIRESLCRFFTTFFTDLAGTWINDSILTTLNEGYFIAALVGFTTDPGTKDGPSKDDSTQIAALLFF